MEQTLTGPDGPLYHLANSRSAEQSAEMQRLEEAGVCLFCPDALAANPDHPALHRTTWWTVTRNRFPYANTRLHLLLLPTAHVRDLVDLPAAAQAEFWDVLAWVREHFELTFYGLGVRCGDCAATGGTIHHVHVHVVVGDVDDPEHQPVRMKLSSPRG